MLRTILRQTSSITAVTLLFSPAPGGAPVSSTQPSTLAKLQRRQREDEKKHFSVNEAIGSEVKHFTDSKHSTFLMRQGLEIILQFTKCSQVCAALDSRASLDDRAAPHLLQLHITALGSRKLFILTLT